MQPTKTTHVIPVRPMYKLRNWWTHNGHVYGQNVDNGNAYMRSTRIKALEKDPQMELRHGDILSGYAADYKLIGGKRRSFSE